MWYIPLAGQDIMFNYRGCFCFNSGECWSDNSTMYALTNNVGDTIASTAE
jgi:hypothetical protein